MKKVDIRDKFYKADRELVYSGAKRKQEKIGLNNVTNEHEVRKTLGDMLPTYSFVIEAQESVTYALKKDGDGFFFLELIK